MHVQRLLIAAAAALVVAACNDAPASVGPSTGSFEGTSSPAPITAPATRATATPASTPPSAAPPTASASTAPTTASSGVCTTEAPTSLSAGWTTLQATTGDFTFRFPAAWDKLYGAFVFNTASLLDETTYAETGLPPFHETRADLVRAPGLGVPNASVLIIPGVVSDTRTVFQRQVARFSSIPGIRVLNPGLSACIDGEHALGIEFTFDKDTTYQQSWFVVKAGRSYDIQWLAQRGQEQLELFKEMLRTWQWTPDLPTITPIPHASTSPAPSRAAASPSASPSASTGLAPSFVLAGMALKADTTAEAANPRDFVTSIPKTATAFYAIFVLKSGLTGEVKGSLRQDGKELVTLSLDYGPEHTWADFRIDAASGIAPGDYTMVITFVPNGEVVNLPFSVK